MRVCQFRHFGTGYKSSAVRQTGSNYKSRKSRGLCQILSGQAGKVQCYLPVTDRESGGGSLGRVRLA